MAYLRHSLYNEVRTDGSRLPLRDKVRLNDLVGGVIVSDGAALVQRQSVPRPCHTRIIGRREGAAHVPSSTGSPFPGSLIALSRQGHTRVSGWLTGGTFRNEAG